MFGPNMLVAPVTTPGMGTVNTTVWLPPGHWTDYFTGRTYRGPSIQPVSSDLSTMPVFVRAGGIVLMRTDDVTNDVQNPLTKVTLNIAEGDDGSYSLYEDDCTTTNPSDSAQTPIRYRARAHTVTIGGARGGFVGQVARRARRPSTVARFPPEI
jgi:alpha-glucosidase (family GH31 glycosyl hydrolase)